MSISFINRKFEALAQREKAVNDYYDVLQRKGKQHPNIKDLRDDYREDLENYGFSKYQLKKEIEEQKQHTQHTEGQQPIPVRVRPQTATIKVVRPTTAPLHNMSEKFEFMESEERFRTQTQQVPKDNKFWRNTKKFDTSQHSQVRNHSALQKIVIDTGGQKHQSNLDRISLQVMEDRINSNKLGDKYSSKQALSARVTDKHSPTEKDKETVLIGFKEQMTSIIKSQSLLPNKTLKLKIQNSQATASVPVIINKVQVDYSVRESKQTGLSTSRPYKTIDQDQVEHMVQMAKLVLQPTFSAVRNQSHYEDMMTKHWDLQITSQFQPYGVVIIEVGSMSMIRMDDVRVIHHKIFYQGDFVELKDLFASLSNSSSLPDQDKFPTSNLFYFMMYQGVLKQGQAGIVYEKFYYDGPLGLPISKQMENLFSLFYLRFLLLEDPQVVHDIETLTHRSIFILKQKQRFPSQMLMFIKALSDRQISVQDKNGQTYLIDVVDLIANDKIQEEIINEPSKPLDKQLETLVFKYDYQQFATQRSSATIKRPTSVQTIERIHSYSKISNSHFPSYTQSLKGSKRFIPPPPKNEEFQLLMTKEAPVVPYHQTTEASPAERRPFSSQFATSFNRIEDENMSTVIKLISSKTNQSSIYQTNKQGLRPQSAIMKRKPIVDKNARFMKRVRNSANILVKGIGFEE